MSNITIVTGIWDLGRDSLSQEWSRSFSHYLDNFIKLLDSLKDTNLIIFIDKSLEDTVWQHREKHNTAIYYHNKEQFGGNFFPFFDKVQSIRTNHSWQNIAGWLKNSTQSQMEWYNPMVMSKMFLLNNAKIFNPFNSEYLFWLDGGITNTVHPGYFSKDKVIEKIPEIVDKFFFVCFPYDAENEIHGFEIKKLKSYAKSERVDRVARGGFFGGHIEYISEANSLYYSLLDNSLNEGLMGTEESIFTIMTYLDPTVYKFEMIESNGLINRFFENIKNRETAKHIELKNPTRKPNKNNKIAVYINTFNFPEQLQMVLDSFQKYDKSFLEKAELILINNSTKDSVFSKYDTICNNYGFVDHIKKGNLGICRARQFAAEHFDSIGYKYMFFFEDDMLLDFDGSCQFGLSKNVPNLFDKCIRIMDIENFDFLKLSFSEFYGHNGDQWSWHNVPSEKRIKYFGINNTRPPTKFNQIKTYRETPYANGEIYYCNWPQIIDQEGSKKLFLDTKWEHPMEQTWMSHIYSLTIENKISPGILLKSPITHNRVYHYNNEERKEN